MFLDLMRDKSRTFPDVSEPERYTSARIWNCGYATLWPVSRLVNCRSLKVLAFPDSTFDMFAALSDLESLEITHLPKVRDLSGLAALRSLTMLELATLPSWDASGKVTEVDSLAPLRWLPNLRELHLFGVRPPNRSVEDIIAIPSLRVARISKYPKQEILRLESELAKRN
jgi:hypothetical protein